MDDILTFLRDSIWTFLAIPITVLLTVWTIKRADKRLAYLPTLQKVVSLSDDFGGKLQLVYDGRPRSNVTLLVLGFKNNGGQPIAREDFDRPLELRLCGASPEILSYAIDFESPAEIGAQLAKVSSATVRLSPLLLNAGDMVFVRLLVSDYEGFELDYRVRGVRTISQVGSFENGPTVVGRFARTYLVLMGIFTLIASRPGVEIPYPYWVVAVALVLLTAAVIQYGRLVNILKAKFV